MARPTVKYKKDTLLLFNFFTYVFPFKYAFEVTSVASLYIFHLGLRLHRFFCYFRKMWRESDVRGKLIKLCQNIQSKAFSIMYYGLVSISWTNMLCDLLKKEIYLASDLLNTTSCNLVIKVTSIQLSHAARLFTNGPRSFRQKLGVGIFFVGNYFLKLFVGIWLMTKMNSRLVDYRVQVFWNSTLLSCFHHGALNFLVG